MKMCRQLGSNTTNKRLQGGKYNKFVPEKTPPVLGKGYEMRKDGWRKQR